MLKLLKYEWMSRWKFFLAGAIFCILLNIDILNSIINKSEPSFGGILFAIVFAMGLFLAFDHIRRMYKNLFSEEGQFLFFIPLNGYKILGSKIINIILECTAVILFASIVGVVDLKILNNKFSNDFYINIPDGFFTIVGRLLLIILITYVIFLLISYLSMALAKSFFSSIKYGKLLSFILFIINVKIITKISNWVFQISDSHLSLAKGLDVMVVSNKYFLFNLCIIALLFVFTGYLLDRRLNL